ncbi:MAG: alpha/beta hydrolase [Betaproteobacteria bacterium RIFCSPHIGHO2_12_FULL_69_13]|nr:MAG: alpha/beta hydrolase [Betaproteobacteria bacterium RIFCSPHIGHO2_12_FULL_69_13]OGA68204.1 MAG: alpha/beta hydrolase [Betaproteobacteria bacterium RIFCSPLOWO2_12_FULL_68_20]
MSDYTAPWWLPGGHLQTVYASLRPPPRVPLERERWETPDGDFIDVDYAGEARARRLLVLFHGLEGGSQSHYARAFAAHACAAGWRLALPQWRGCSGEPNRKPRAYHSGDSDEVDWILQRFAARTVELFAAGVSLGGNALLKWLGERAEEARRIVRRAAAVSAPLDLGAAGRALDRGLNRILYTRHFLSTLRPKSLEKLERFPGLYDTALVRRARTMHEFDDAVTAPLHGFRDADDYWARASSSPWLSAVRVPTLVLNARNDPFLPEAALEAAARQASSSLLLEFPRTGGHAGFLEGPFPGRHTWLPRHLVQFLGA